MPKCLERAKWKYILAGHFIYTNDRSPHSHSTARLQRKTITDAAKDVLKPVNDVASAAALKGVEGVEAVSNAAKSTIAGSSKTAEGTLDNAKGELKKAQGEAQSKAEELKQKM
ncbi:protein of unknown function [Taphrina deformans PYCC 5710]|uniref:LEA domain protein n=1 Tax=Taphrina deformans (strain PYCC 5710 / ATCC 11124 / CBS 356.35 / IMI 108563 / JCM 9778 / NBRC 8474) TaxID=1097556 RepID=R4XGR0_TAPDE|nr:protein of unknown function [Taphrina deformans PYCC 5710]|eukprot:CCG82571.1 protein of unknown function [Taphrina deformans PYCC 5710]